MKPRTIFIFSILLFQFCNISAQNFWPFVQDQKSYFSGPSGSLICISFDSVVNKNDTIRYYNYPVPKISENHLDCKRIKNASWLGIECFIVDSSLHMINESEDTIHIHFNAKPGDYWQFLKESPTKFILATIDDLEITQTLGVQDTLKRIILKPIGYDNSDTQYIESLGDIILSSTFGLLKMVDFYEYPNPYWLTPEGSFILINQGDVGLPIITLRDAFDINPGDILHYYDITYWEIDKISEQKEINICLEKTINTNSDSVSLKIDRSYKRFNYTIDEETHVSEISDINYVHDTIVRRYSIAPIFPFRRPEVINDIFQPYEIYQHSNPDLDYFGRRKIVSNYQLYVFDDCIDIPIGEGFPVYYYVDGLGEMYVSGDNWGSSSRKVVYYNKGEGEEDIWGDPWSSAELLDTEDKKLPVQYKIYPNPSEGILNIELLSTEDVSISIYNSLGASVINQAEVKNNESIDISNQAPGIYFYKLSNNKEELDKGIIILQD